MTGIRVPTISKELLSGSTDGLQIPVTGTDTAGAVTIHTAHASATDEVWLSATNPTAAAVKLTLEIGGTTVGFHRIIEVPAESTIWVISGDLVLTNSQVIEAFAATADAINLAGYVNRITNPA